jgi:hypothetical protein
MELRNEHVLNIQGDEDLALDKIKASVDETEAARLFWMFSNLYKDVYGSIVREYTSNCFDSHAEAGIDDPVIVELDEKEIKFKDVGVGLSPERVRHVFMKYLSSTKRGTNDQIGGFGIGSKTALAYQDSFKITTRFDGFEYVYILHKGATGEPELELIIKVPTTERNGTIVTVSLKEYDFNNFQDAIERQLKYFDNVIVYINGRQENAYHIIEHNLFKVRFEEGYYQTSGTLHLVIGKVRYDLDFSRVNVPKGLNNVGLAVKFDIGDLQVTPSREDIVYSIEAIKKIEERLTLISVYITETVNSQIIYTDDFFQAWERRKDTIQTIPFDINGKTYSLRVSTTNLNSVIYHPCPNLINNLSARNFYISEDSILQQSGVEWHGRFSESGTISNRGTRPLNFSNLKGAVYIYDSEKCKSSGIKNKYLFSIHTGYIHLLKLPEEKINFFNCPYIKMFRIAGAPFSVIKSIVLSVKEKFDNLKLPNYVDVEIDENWLKEYRQKQRDTRVKLEGKIPATKWTAYTSAIDFDLSHLSPKKITIIGTREQKDHLRALGSIIAGTQIKKRSKKQKETRIDKIDSYEFRYEKWVPEVLMLSQQNYTKLSKSPYVYTMDKLAEEFPSILKNFVTANWIRENYENVIKSHRNDAVVLNIISKLFPTLLAEVAQLRHFVSNQSLGINDPIRQEIYKYGVQKGWVDTTSKFTLERYAHIINKLGIFTKLNVNFPLDEADYLVISKYLVNQGVLPEKPQTPVKLEVQTGEIEPIEELELEPND